MGGGIGKALGGIQRELVKPAIRSYYEWAGLCVREHQLSQIMTGLVITRGWESVSDEEWFFRWPELVKGWEKTVYLEGMKYARINHRWTDEREYWNDQYKSYSNLHLQTCRDYLGLYMSSFVWQEAIHQDGERRREEEERRERERWKKLSLFQKLKEKVLRRPYSSS